MTELTAVPELLAPAGDWESLRAAVANGADAVYFGLPLFNARHRATNFQLDELPDVMAYLHTRGVKGYVTFNTLIFADEWPTVVEFLNAIVKARVDAVIVQDIGLAWLIRERFPTLAVHGSTQMTLTEPRGINMVRSLGIERVILARELSLADIRKVRAGTSVPVEVFVHGALCVAYSGQCLTSEALGGRSANRGQCAQACRLPYEMLVDGKPHDLGEKAYLLSPQDLAAPDLVHDLVQAGVCSLKIEGRLKGGPYVAAATRVYRAALDAAGAGRAFQISPQELVDLEQTFSRGFSQGFLGGLNHQTLVPGRFPKHRGVRLGTVVGSSKHGVMIDVLDADRTGIPKPGDGVVFDLGKPEEDEPGGRIFTVHEIVPGQRFEVRFATEAVVPRQVPVGALVWRTDDPAIRKRLENSYARDKPTVQEGVNVVVTGAVGEPLRLEFRTVGGREAVVTWAGPLAAAVKHPATEASVREQLGRLHDTPFTLHHVDFRCRGGVLIPKSVLNDLRRQAVAQLLATQTRPEEVPSVSAEAVAAWRQQRRAHLSATLPPEHPQLTLLVRTREQLDAALAWQPSAGLARPAVIYCDFEDVRRYREAVAAARAASQPIGLATLRVIKPGEESWLRLIAEYGPDVVLVRNLAGVSFFREAAPHLPLVGDFSLNVTNDVAAAWYLEQGLTRVVPGFDLNWDQLQALMQASDTGRFEVVVHYHMPMFHMEHCVFAAGLSTGKDWRDCGRPCDRHRVDLHDRAGAKFPLIPDAGCRNTVYNAVPQSAAEYLSRMVGLGLRHFRLELLRESANQVGRLLGLYQHFLAGHVDGRTAWKELRVMQQLGVTRGTLQMI